MPNYERGLQITRESWNPVKSIQFPLVTFENRIALTQNHWTVGYKNKTTIVWQALFCDGIGSLDSPNSII